jgi:hypothetical protein
MAHLSRLYPGEEIVGIEPLAPDTGATHGRTEKAAGYGLPFHVTLAGREGKRRELVWRTASANEFGHDRRADRAAGMIQAFDDFGQLPDHVEAVDLGMVSSSGSLHSLRDCGEPYVITSFAPGTIYADDLRRIASEGVTRDLDLARVETLARYLAELHAPIADGAIRYRRAIRDLVGSGEGIYGILDGYPDGVPGADSERLQAIEDRCARWRWRLRERHDRLTRTHGDFHPFNIVFGAGTDLTLLDASRGACGDPADDLTAMAVNFLLFALDAPNAWPHGLGVLWRRWWPDYFAVRDDAELLAVAPPFFAWRALVVCNPRFYPKLSAAARDKLLGFAEDLLDEGCLDPMWAEELFV